MVRVFVQFIKMNKQINGIHTVNITMIITPTRQITITHNPNNNKFKTKKKSKTKMQDKEKQKDKPQPNQPEQNQQTQATTPTNTTSNIEVQQNLSPQQTRIQLNESQKQCRVLQTKNKKLQAKYIELFKEQKLLKKDWTALTNIIREILPNLEEKPLGRYDIEEMKELWNTKEGIMIRKVQDMQENMEKFKEKVQRQANQFAEEKIERVMRQCKEKVDAVNKQLDSFKKNSKNLGEQLSDYDKKLQAKSDQVSKLTKQKLKLEHTINQMKVKSITDQLSNKSPEDEKINAQRNQILSLRHQVSELMHKRDQLRNQLKSTKATIDKLKTVIQQKNKQIKKLSEDRAQSNGQSDKKQHHNHHLQHIQPPTIQKKQSISSISEDNDQNQKNFEHESNLAGDSDYIHRQYMKNVFMRYMKSWAKGDQTQTQILLNIILTMLKFDVKEREVVSEKKKTWFGIY